MFEVENGFCKFRIEDNGVLVIHAGESRVVLRTEDRDALIMFLDTFRGRI